MQEQPTYPCCKHCVHKSDYVHEAPCFVDGCQPQEVDKRQQETSKL